MLSVEQMKHLTFHGFSNSRISNVHVCMCALRSHPIAPLNVKCMLISPVLQLHTVRRENVGKGLFYLVTVALEAVEAVLVVVEGVSVLATEAWVACSVLSQSLSYPNNMTTHNALGLYLPRNLRFHYRNSLFHILILVLSAVRPDTCFLRLDVREPFRQVAKGGVGHKALLVSAVV